MVERSSVSSNPLVSLITVVFNGERYLEETIQSVLRQSYPNLEYIVIDGGSTDRTLEIIERYSESISYWVSEPDRGIYNAMNKGIRAAQGEIVALINADDWLEAGAVQRAVAAFGEDREIGIVHGDLRYHRLGGDISIKVPHLNEQRMIWLGMSCFHPTCFVRKEIYRERLYDERYRILSDYKFVLESQRAGVKFGYVPSIQANMREGGISNDIASCLREWNQIRRELGYNETVIFTSSVFRILRHSIAKLKWRINDTVRRNLLPPPGGAQRG